MSTSQPAAYPPAVQRLADLATELGLEVVYLAPTGFTQLIEIKLPLPERHVDLQSDALWVMWTRPYGNPTGRARVRITHYRPYLTQRSQTRKLRQREARQQIRWLAEDLERNRRVIANRTTEK